MKKVKLPVIVKTHVTVDVSELEQACRDAYAARKQKTIDSMIRLIDEEIRVMTVYRAESFTQDIHNAIVSLVAERVDSSIDSMVQEMVDAELKRRLK